ncbi:MAG: prolyl oligopeptidase family serine peptidase [Patescibacteria group bacterium]|nr:prolyl oligopeptidase family serine peptidase [Patescibacteria group bacterium]
MKNDAVLHELGANPIVREAKKITITAELRKRFGPKSAKEVEGNRRFMAAYRLIYTSQGHAVVGYIVVPKKHATRAPTIVFNRGGSGEFGAIRIGWLFSGTIAALARAGYVVIASQYSGVTGGEGVDEMGGSDLSDVINLKKIIAGLSFCDTQKIGMYGISRGGIMTYRTLQKTRWVHAAVVVSGPTDLFFNEKYRPEMRKHFQKMFGGSREEKKKRSVLYWYKEISRTVPLLVLCGMADWRVDPRGAFRFAEKATGHFRDFKLIAYPRGTHVLEEYETQVDQEIVNWFDTFLN